MSGVPLWTTILGLRIDDDGRFLRGGARVRR